MPKVSVIMPVYNAEKYIQEAINSILNQTFEDLEFIIINDGSIDHTEELVNKYEDPRIRFIQNKTNLGIAKTLNRGLDLANGEYIARMDSDDISMPERLAKQVDYLEHHPEICVLGTGIECFGACWDKYIFSKESTQLKVDLLFNNCLAHPSVMMRSSILGKNGFYYDSAFSKIEDYDLWCRIVEHYHLASIPEVLLKYRVHPNQVTQTISQKKELQLRKLKMRQMRQLNMSLTSEGFEEYFLYCQGKLNANYDSIVKLYYFFREIKRNNYVTKIYSHRYLSTTLHSIIRSLLFKIPWKESFYVASKCGYNMVIYASERSINSLSQKIKEDIKQRRLRTKLKQREFTLISNNCWGGFIYQKYGLKYRTPTIGLFILGHDFVKLARDWRYYFDQRLEFISWECATYHYALKEVSPFPVAILGDIEIYFMHYHSEQEAAEKWNRRIERIIPERMVFKLSQREVCSRDDIEKFIELPLLHKICFAHDNVPGTIYIPELDGWIGDEMSLVNRYYDEISLLNNL